MSISGTSATSNILQANRIGTNAVGTGGLGNNTGVEIDGASNNSVGGTSTTRGNVIGFNSNAGVIVANSGVGNVIRTNAIYANTNSGILLQSGGNALQTPPVLNLATSGGSTTTIQFNTAGLTAGSVLEFFTSVSGDPSTNDQAHVFLGSDTITAGDLLNPIKSVTFSTGTPISQYVVASQTTSANNTSGFAIRTQVFNPFRVTTTDDNGNDTSPIAGSLRAAIINTNNNPGADTISFAILGNGTHTLTLFNNTPLPAITGSVVIDATSQSGYNGSPLIRLDGGNAVGVGLTLASSSNGSTIQGLDLVRFKSAAILVQSNGNSVLANYIGADFDGTDKTLGNGAGVSVTGANNVIGGTSGFSANLIAFNSVAGVIVDGGTGNAVRGNSIFSNTAPQISLANSGNANQPAPGLTAASASAGTTIVTGTLDPNAGFIASTTYTLDFYASAPGIPPGPRRTSTSEVSPRRPTPRE